jgi:hypothetical protein
MQMTEDEAFGVRAPQVIERRGGARSPLPGRKCKRAVRLLRRLVGG